MVSLVLTFSLLFVTFSSYIVEAANYSNGYSMAAVSLNPIDACWRRNPNWSTSRQALANCAVGFGKAAIGGRQGPIYVVTSPVDDFKNPKPGTLRYAVIQPKPLWITFATDMVIKLQSELMVNSYKTIDGRGVKVDIGNGPCLLVYRAHHVIIHGLTIHDCKRGGMKRAGDGDGIDLYQATHVWVDHCHFSRCFDGLIDVVHSSTAITISNNYFTQHEKTILLGHNDNYVDDKKMKVTVAFNHFGPGLTSRMPRVRRGYAHVANNFYEPWKMYAIGGSGDPIIFSQGNYFIAANDPKLKQVTKRISATDAKRWKWSSSTDVFKNGAFFVASGGVVPKPMYQKGEAFTVAHGSLVPSLTANAGPLPCKPGAAC
ncbi:unnamed protein product [Cochlearia groenlandica]